MMKPPMAGVLERTIRSIDRSDRCLPPTLLPNLPLSLESASLSSHLAASLATHTLTPPSHLAASLTSRARG